MGSHMIYDITSLKSVRESLKRSHFFQLSCSAFKGNPACILKSPRERQCDLTRHDKAFPAAWFTARVQNLGHFLTNFHAKS